AAGVRREPLPRPRPRAAREIEEAAVVLPDLEARSRRFEDLVEPPGSPRGVDDDVRVDPPRLPGDVDLDTAHAHRLPALEHEPVHVGIGAERRDPLLFDVETKQPLESRPPRPRLLPPSRRRARS